MIIQFSRMPPAHPKLALSTTLGFLEYVHVPVEHIKMGLNVYNNMGVCFWCPANFYCPGTSAPIPCPSETWLILWQGLVSWCCWTVHADIFYNFDSAIVPSVNPLNMTTKNSVAGDFSLTNSNCHSGSAYCLSDATYSEDFRFITYFPSNPFTVSYWQYLNEQILRTRACRVLSTPACLVKLIHW